MESSLGYVNVIEESTNNVVPSKYHEVILRSLQADKYLGDIKDVNINKYSTSKSHLLVSVSEIFCDNIMLYKIMKKEDTIRENNQLLLNTNNRKITNLEIKECFSKGGLVLNALDVKIKHVISANSENTKSYILSRVNKNLKIDDKIATFKVSLSDLKLGAIIEKIPSILINLEEKGFFILDVDITQDFKGSFDENDVKKIFEDHEFLLLDSFSNTCVSCIHDDCRIKVYNKTACQFKSPGLTVNFGSNLFNYLNCTQERLGKSFEETIEEGLIRIEITSNSFNKGLSMLEQIKMCLTDLTIYYTPSYLQLKSLTDEIKQTVCILDREQQKYYFCYYCDSSTNKFIGYSSSKCKFTETSYKLILSMFSIKGIPTIFIDIQEKKPTKIMLRTFIKDKGETIITSSSSMFSVLAKDISKYKLDRTGINFTTLYKTYKINSAPLFDIKEIENISDLSIKICNKRNLNKLIEKEQINRQVAEIENTKDLRKKEITEELCRNKEKCFISKTELDTLKLINKKTNKYKTSLLSGLKNETILEIRGYEINNDLFSTLLTNEGTFQNEERLKQKMQGLFLSDLKHEQFFVFELNRAYSLLKKPLFIIKKLKRDEFVILEMIDKKLLKEIKSDYIINTKVQLDLCIDQFINVKDCRKLESLEKGKEYFIAEVFRTTFRSKIRYVITLQNEGIFISNESCKSELEKLFIKSEEKCVHKIDKVISEKILILKTVDFYTNSQKHKEMLVRIIDTNRLDPDKTFYNISHVDRSVLFQNDSEEIKKLKTFFEQKRREISEYESIVEHYKDELQLHNFERSSLKCDEFTEETLRSSVTIKMKNNYNSKIHKHPFHERRPRRIGGLINGQTVKVFAFTNKFTYLITDLGVFENNNENLKEQMNKYLPEKEIKWPSFINYLFCSSIFEKPIFTLLKQTTISIIDALNITAVSAYNNLHSVQIKHRDYLDDLEEQTRKEFKDLNFDKLYLIEDVFRSDTYDEKIKLLLSDREQIFTVYLPVRFYNITEELFQTLKSKQLGLICEGINIYNDYELKFENLSSTLIPEKNIQ